MSKFLIQSTEGRWVAYDFGLRTPYLTGDSARRFVFGSKQEAEHQLPIYRRAFLKFQGLEVDLSVVEAKQ